MEKQLLHGLVPRVYSTNPDNPEEGRTFVWSTIGWFERLEGESGDVAFSPFADSEEELHNLLSSEADYEFDELDDEFAREVREEFMNQSPLYPEAPEVSDEPLEEEESDPIYTYLHLQEEEQDEAISE